MKQMTLATAGFDKYAKTTHRAMFLFEMNRVVPWPMLCQLIEPHYPKASNGRPPVGLEPVPDETTVCKFRHFLERHDLGRRLFEEMGRHLQAQGMQVSCGTIVDAIIIAAPSSIRNVSGERNPDMRQTKEGNSCAHARGAADEPAQIARTFQGGACFRYH